MAKTFLPKNIRIARKARKDYVASLTKASARYLYTPMPEDIIRPLGRAYDLAMWSRASAE